MRLGSAIALELLVAAGAVGGVVFGVTRAARLAEGYLVTPAVAAAVEPATLVLPRAELRVAPPVLAPPGVFGGPDEVLLAPLNATPIVKTKVNHGGTSLSLRLDFASGARAAFKPEQIWEQSDPRKEIAAYRIDRLLRIHRVPPATWGTVDVREVVAAVEPRYQPFVAMRLREEALPKDGKLSGELSWWVPEIVPARLGKLELESPEAKAQWTAYLTPGASIPVEARPIVTQLAVMIVFDALVDNDDRWSGANLKMSPDGATLYTMDNTLTFSTEVALSQMPASALRRVQRFPRDLVTRLRALTLDSLQATVTLRGTGFADPRMLLTLPELQAILTRRDRIVDHIDRLIADLGEDAVLSL